MKSNERAGDAEAISDALGAFFECCDSPAAICDLKLHVLVANEPFQRLCGSGTALSRPLDRLFDGQTFPVPASGGSTELFAKNRVGERVLIQLVRRGERVVVLPKTTRAAENRVRAQTEHTLLNCLEGLLEHANALIVATDRQGRIQLFSKLFSSLTGWRKEEVLGRDLLGLIPEGERKRVAQVLATALRGEGGSNFETRIIGCLGKEARVSLASSPLLGADGHVDGMIALGQDLTTLKELEHRIIHAEKLASMGRFAASVAHEINNPLTAVVSYADALLARSISTENPDREKLRKILDGCERILRFTRQLVSYARPSPDRLERVELNTLLDTALSYCDHVLSHYGIAVEKEYQAVPEVLAIKGNLAQVFVNLITNACQAMQPGGSLHLSTTREGVDAVIRVTDNGKGMDLQTVERVFEPFFTTKPDGVGSGLGLCIAQNIVESHGGKIDVESSIGNGTTFVIRLPVPSGDTVLQTLTFDAPPAESATV
jgi:PAS domain S-box-containing protein